MNGALRAHSDEIVARALATLFDGVTDVPSTNTGGAFQLVFARSARGEQGRQRPCGEAKRGL